MSIDVLNGLFSSLEDWLWRLIYRSAFPLLRLWWILRRPRHRGALVAAYLGRDLLLLRASYRLAWNFPGGGLRPQEMPEQAARREFQEETGLLVPLLKPSGVVEGIFDGRHDTIHFFELHFEQPPRLIVDNREIVEARFVPPEALASLRLTGPVLAYLQQRQILEVTQPARRHA